MTINSPAAIGVKLSPGGIVIPNTVTGTAPVLSLPTGYTINTTGTDGNIPSVVTTSTTKPTQQQIVDKQDHLGNPAINLTQDVVVTGLQVIPVFGLSTSITYYRHFVHVAADASRSAVVTSPGFIFDGALVDSWMSFDMRSEAGYPTSCIQAACNINNLDGVSWGAASGGSGTANVDFLSTEANIDAALPGGNGDFGQRIYVGNVSNNNLTNPSKFEFITKAPEFWIRWYHRYELGFDYGAGGPNYDKWLYIYSEGNLAASESIIIEPGGGAFLLFSSVMGTVIQDSTFDWTDAFGRTSDGVHKLVNVHVKLDTDGTDGEFEYLIGNTTVCAATGLNICGGDTGFQAGMKRFHIGANQEAPVHAELTKYVDMSDFAITTVAPTTLSPAGKPWIGPVNGIIGVSP